MIFPKPVRNRQRRDKTRNAAMVRADGDINESNLPRLQPQLLPRRSFCSYSRIMRHYRELNTTAPLMLIDKLRGTARLVWFLVTAAFVFVPLDDILLEKARSNYAQLSCRKENEFLKS
jgi:hypothetical protein